MSSGLEIGSVKLFIEGLGRGGLLGKVRCCLGCRHDRLLKRVGGDARKEEERGDELQGCAGSSCCRCKSERVATGQRVK